MSWYHGGQGYYDDGFHGDDDYFDDDFDGGGYRRHDPGYMYHQGGGSGQGRAGPNEGNSQGHAPGCRFRGGGGHGGGNGGPSCGSGSGGGGENGRQESRQTQHQSQQGYRDDLYYHNHNHNFYDDEPWWEPMRSGTQNPRSEGNNPPMMSGALPARGQRNGLHGGGGGGGGQQEASRGVDRTRVCTAIRGLRTVDTAEDMVEDTAEGMNMAVTICLITGTNGTNVRWGDWLQ
jgi:hypothetical protein